MITISILLAINSIFIVCLTRRFFYTSKQVYEISTTQTRHNASLTNWISIFEKKHNDVPRFVQQCIDNYMQKKYPQIKDDDFDKRVNEVCEKYYCEKYEFLKKHFDDEFLLYNGRWFEKAKKLIIEDRELIRERLENKSNVAT